MLANKPWMLKMMRQSGRSLWVFVILFLNIPNAAQAEKRNDGGQGATGLAELAVKANPGIAAISSGIKALQQRIHGAGAWMDPVLSLNYMNMPVDRWAPGATPMSGIGRPQLRIGIA